LMSLLHSYTNTLGFIYNPPYPYWLDHALNDRRGANFNMNGHYLGALEDFAQVLGWLNEEDSDVFQTRADLLRQSLRTHLWDPERQLFADAWIDGELSDQFSEHANGMALAMKVANKEQADLVVKELLANDEHNYIKRTSGITIVTPAMSYFLHKGLCSYGYTDESFKLLRSRFDKMLAPNTNGTLWEEWWLDGTGRSGKFQGGRTRSDAQTESAFPPALFAEYLLGINPSKPGMKEVEISRPQSAIQQIEAKIPSPEGELVVKWNFDQNKGGELELEIPGEMQVKFNIASLSITSDQSIVVDGKELKLGKQDSAYIILSGGSHQVSF
jgi:alpha-L-rhamnosidase